MVGFVIATHASIGKELCICLQGILGEQKGVAAVSVDFTKTVETARREILDAIRRVDDGEGVILLTDMFGGTPTNISLSFLENQRVEVVSGVNLPMLIKGIALRKEYSLTELSSRLEEAGKRGIIVASSLLKQGQGQRG